MISVGEVVLVVGSVFVQIWTVGVLVSKTFLYVVVGVWELFKFGLALLLLIKTWREGKTKERGRKTRARRRINVRCGNNTSSLASLPYTINENSTNNKNNKMTSFNPDMVEGFDELAQDLKPEKDFMRAVRRTYGSIFKLLTEGAKYHDIKIDRTIVAGSIGKGTCISYTYEDDDGDDIVKNPDVDIVAFVNDEGPPFDEVLEAFKEILEDDSSISHLRITNISVQFDYYDWDSGITIPIDLLPGRNYVKSSELGWRTTACLQAEMAQKKLWKIHKNAIKTEKKLNLEENKLHSTGFCEKSVQVISCHVKDDFVASVVRLAKYWSTGVDLTGYGFLASRSCIIEMIAIDAQVGAGRGCLISGFKRFLESVANFRNLYINFHPKNNNNNNNKDSPKKGGRMPMPFIIDPANKFNNLAHGITPEQVQVFEGQAKKTLKMLQELRRRKAYVLVENPIDDIFSHKW